MYGMYTNASADTLGTTISRVSTVYYDARDN